MRKISKSDTLDKEQESKDKEWLATRKYSHHFAVGTYVVCASRRYLVEEYRGRNVIVTDENGGAYVFVNPYFVRGVIRGVNSVG